MSKKSSVTVHRPKTYKEFQELNTLLNKKGYMAIDALKPGHVHTVSLQSDGAAQGAQDLSSCFETGVWSNGPLAQVAWSFDERTNTVVPVKGKDGKPMGLGYVKWGSGNCTPSSMPPLAMALPYTAAPLRYIADLTAGLGPKLMYRFPGGKLCEFRDAGERLLAEWETAKAAAQEAPAQEAPAPIIPRGSVSPTGSSEESSAEKRARLAYEAWRKTWYGSEEEDDLGIKEHIPGAKDFLDENNLNLHLSQCEQDDVMLDIYFPTVGFSTKGRRGKWAPKISRIGVLPAHSCRLEKMNDSRHINHVYFSDQWRTLGAKSPKKVVSAPEDTKIVMYPAAMPQHLLCELRYLVKDNQKTAAGRRPMWVSCPTFYPSGNKPYYPQPAWWSVFSSKAFDFSSTILYDKAKQRENRTSWGKIFYISLDYLEAVFSKEGFVGNEEKKTQFLEELEASMEDFLQHRENHGKMMRQWMWEGKDGKDHHNVEIVDVAETTKDEVAAGKDELELATSPIFLALGVDPRLVGVPMVKSSNGGTAVRELHLLKQQQLSVKQRLYLQFLNAVARFNEWDEHAEFHIVQQTLTTLDNSKTGTVETISGEEA